MTDEVVPYYWEIHDVTGSHIEILPYFDAKRHHDECQDFENTLYSEYGPAIGSFDNRFPLESFTNLFGV